MVKLVHERVKPMHENPLASTLTIPALVSTGPDPDLAEKLHLFGQFVGSWALDLTWFQDGQPVRREAGEWHFAWVLEGRAVQDIWIVPPREQRGAGNLYEYGTTIRFYDPTIDAWRSTWHGPMVKCVIPFIGRQVGDEIVLEGRHWQNPDWPMHWIFSDVTGHAFAWRNMISQDGGTTWEKVLGFSARRTSPAT